MLKCVNTFIVYNNRKTNFTIVAMQSDSKNKISTNKLMFCKFNGIYNENKVILYGILL